MSTQNNRNGANLRLRTLKEIFTKNCHNLACSRRSDSGEWCEVKRSAKLSPQFPSTFHRLLYFAPLSTI